MIIGLLGMASCIDFSKFDLNYTKMDRRNQNLIEVLKRYLLDNDINIVSEKERLFELSNPNMPNVIVTAQYVVSSPTNQYFHGSKNNTPIDTVARFQIPDLGIKSPPRFFIFPFHNPKRGKLNFAIVPSRKLIEKAQCTFEPR